MRSEAMPAQYLHWDELRRRPVPEGYTHEEWWHAIKLSRIRDVKPISLTDLAGRPFQLSQPDEVLKDLHFIDLGAGGLLGLPEPITNPQTKDRYLINSLIEEAITSSQLEGATTTRDVAKEMIRTKRPPRDISERMILNNFRTMQHIREIKDEPLSQELVFRIHRMVTDETLEDPTAGGRLRNDHEKRAVMDNDNQVVHTPPPAEELEARMQAMCAFANGEAPGYFVHPAIRAIVLHFWLAYDHPFVDGNGRTARALFYWAMLRGGYWLFEFISISNILRSAPAQYGRSFLYCETDDNDLTYFLIAQAQVIRQALVELNKYTERKTRETREAESHLRAIGLLNHRQVAVVQHALKHPGQEYTITSHQTSHRIAYETSRTDLLDLSQRGILELRKRGKQMVFLVPHDIAERLRKLGQDSAAG